MVEDTNIKESGALPQRDELDARRRARRKGEQCLHFRERHSLRGGGATRSSMTTGASTMASTTPRMALQQRYRVSSSTVSW